ncbi:ATP-dependent zinc metalloprotease FtsH [Clostridium sporogenes]|uniref:ATP-dependent zinc metalloprotease FtsH n=1 Tax=Clostridium sporogenes TaxID=1509 RepID=UPI000D9416FD|nr:ATP-dependent zinc metalloprotease FtsH [Clostridium sporogenes]SQB57386.1 ATP-dependent metalloprotease FtsH [Clostridium sporogenes]
MKKFSSATAWIVVLILVIFSSLMLVRTGTNSTAINFSEFQKNWIQNEIKSFQVKDDKMTVVGTLKDGTQYETVVPSERLFQFINEHPKNGEVKEVYVKPTSVPIWVQYLPMILIVLMLLGFWFMFMQQAQGGGGNRNVMNFGKSKAKMATPDKKKVTFDDVAGEAGVPFFSISGSDFVEMFVGVGASRVRDLFEQAKKNSPCIVFIDEIDAVGRQRGAGLGGGHDEREQTLNQLLVEMDGFGANEGIIMIAATNRPDILDPALLRPGRFDRQIVVGAPDVKGREAILKVHSKNKHLAEEIKLEILAKRTPGFTGADLENLMNESALLAVRKRKELIDMEDLEEAVTRVIAGPEKKSRVIDEEDRKLTAYHEAGHAVVMKLLPHADPVHQISIVPRGMAGGYTMHLPEKDSSYMSKSKLEDEIVGLLGGRVAEKLIIGDISTGAKNDIDRATTIARKMVMDYGMSNTLGPIAFGSGHDEVFLGRDLGKGRNFSEDVAYKIDQEIKKLIDTGYNEAERLLNENISKLHAVAQELLKKEKLEANEFEEIFKNS